MNRLSKLVFAGLLAGTSWTFPAGAAQAQIYARPTTSPYQQPAVSYYPQPVPGGNLLQPVYIPPPSNYSFYGPSTGTVGYVATTSYYQQPGPCRDRLVPTTTLVPVWGYTPGYYSGYYTPGYYRP